MVYGRSTYGIHGFIYFIYTNMSKGASPCANCWPLGSRLTWVLCLPSLNGSKWLVVGWHLGGTSRFFSESALDHLDLQQNATHRTNFFEGVVDGVTIPGEKKMSPCWAQLFFSTWKKEDRNKERCETSWPWWKKTKIWLMQAMDSCWSCWKATNKSTT